MDSVGCPACQTRYAFSRLGLTVPNDANTTVTALIICLVCAAKFEAVVRWKSVKQPGKLQTWMDKMLRRVAAPVFAFEIEAVSKLQQQE